MTDPLQLDDAKRICREHGFEPAGKRWGDIQHFVENHPPFWPQLRGRLLRSLAAGVRRF